MRRTLKKITCAIFVIFITVFGVLAFVLPNHSFSDNENRVLASAPNFSIKQLLSSKYNKEFETYYTDQFPFRDLWIMIKAASGKAQLKIENNNVYFGNDGKLIPQVLTYDEELVDRNIKTINNFADTVDAQTSFMVIPGPSYGEKSDLPAFSYNVNQQSIIDTMKDDMIVDNFVDTSDALINANNTSDKSPYFKTDHHWNEVGAKIGYETLMDSLNINPETFNYELAATDFKGTMYSKSGIFWEKGDDIYTITPENDVKVSVVYENDETTKTDTIYSTNRLNEKDKYTYYLDGNHGIVTIDTDVDTDQTLLVIKDSYAHILIPYLVPHYKKIVVVDLRYYRMGVSDLVKQENLNNVLILYSVDNFITDTNIGLLR